MALVTQSHSLKSFQRAGWSDGQKHFTVWCVVMFRLQTFLQLVYVHAETYFNSSGFVVYWCTWYSTTDCFERAMNLPTLYLCYVLLC